MLKKEINKIFKRKKIIKFTLFILLINLFISVFYVQGKKSIPVVFAEKYILMESSSKRVLYGKNIHSRSLTASICKVLTAIIVIENTNINDYVLVDHNTTLQTGSAIYLKENDLIKIEDLLYGLLLRSGNDCAYLLSNCVCENEDEFACLMNKYAQKIGMSNSTFCNSSGLDDESMNYSTPYDMGLLMIYAMQNNVFRNIVKSKSYISYTGNNEKLYFYNKHKLVQKYDFIIGGKTGYTERAKRTLISYAARDGMELVCVTFNSGNDWNEHLDMIEYGFNNYSLKCVIKKQIIKTNNELDYTPYLNNDIIVPLKKDEKYTIDIRLLKESKNNEDLVGILRIFDLSNGLIIEKEIKRYF